MIIIAGGRISDSKRTKQSFTENGHRVTNKHLESLSGNDLEECVFMATVNVALKPGVVNANVWRSFSIACKHAVTSESSFNELTEGSLVRSVSMQAKLLSSSGNSFAVLSDVD